MKRFRSFGMGLLALSMTVMPVLEFAAAAPTENNNPFSVQIQTAIIQSVTNSMTTGGEVEEDVTIGNDGSDVPVTAEPAATAEPTAEPAQNRNRPRPPTMRTKPRKPRPRSKATC